MHAMESNSNSHSLINTILSKKALTECSRPKNINTTLSKQSNFEIVPRITRRMHKQMSSNQSLNDKCAICLNNFSNDQGYLECGHMFCMVCLIRWWRNHNTCPYCRKEILFIRNRQNQITYKSELPPLQKNEDEKFIANCQLCWGEIESNQPMNICTQCRCVYWHSRCLPFTSNRWYCTQCAQLERQPEQQQIEE